MTTLADLKTRVRDFLGDWEYETRLTAAVTDYTFTAVAGTDVCTATGSSYTNTNQVLVYGDDLPAPLSNGGTYYIRDVSGTTFKLAFTSGGTAIDITDAGTGTHTIVLASKVMSVEDGTQFTAGDIVEVGTEMVLVSSVTSNDLTVKRGRRGTTPPSSHPNGTVVYKGTTWSARQFEQWINECLDFIYPSLYIRVADATLTGSGTDYTYALNAAVTRLRQIERVEYVVGSNLKRHIVRKLRVVGEPPQLYIKADLTGCTIYYTYTKPFTQMTSDTAVTDLPAGAEGLTVYYAAARAVEQREGVRSRFDAYPVAQDERLTREGQQIATGSYYWKLFNSLLAEIEMEQPGMVQV